MVGLFRLDPHLYDQEDLVDTPLPQPTRTGQSASHRQPEGTGGSPTASSGSAQPTRTGQSAPYRQPEGTGGSPTASSGSAQPTRTGQSAPYRQPEGTGGSPTASSGSAGHKETTKGRRKLPKRLLKGMIPQAITSGYRY